MEFKLWLSLTHSHGLQTHVHNTHKQTHTEQVEEIKTGNTPRYKLDVTKQMSGGRQDFKWKSGDPHNEGLRAPN